MGAAWTRSSAGPGYMLLPQVPSRYRNSMFKWFIFLFTYVCYASYHIAKRPLSVVKGVLHQNCTKRDDDWPLQINKSEERSCQSWPPFDQPNYAVLLGSLDYGFLIAYAVSMFFWGYILERMNMRYYMMIGLLGKAFFTAAFGLGYFVEIHNFAYYLVVQISCGVFSATGCPGVVTCLGNWFGKNKRGLLLGIWASNVSVGSIAGAVLAGLFVESAWGWCFILPAIWLTVLAITAFCFLAPQPDDVGCACPHQNKEEPVRTPSPGRSIKFYNSTTPTLEGTERNLYDETSDLLKNEEQKKITICEALKIPGVVEFSLCLFFAKLVLSVFLFWLPFYLKLSAHLTPETAANVSTFFDVGSIMGGIVFGLASDYLRARAVVCSFALLAGCPVMYLYSIHGHTSLSTNIAILIMLGALVSGPCSVVCTAVATDLGSHSSLKGNSRAFATVAAIIDGTGSVGGAFGPFLTGVLSQTGWENVFYMLMACSLLSSMKVLSVKNYFKIPARMENSRWLCWGVIFIWHCEQFGHAFVIARFMVKERLRLCETKTLARQIHFFPTYKQYRLLSPIPYADGASLIISEKQKTLKVNNSVQLF